MEVVEASVGGTVRVILVLLLIWMVIRWLQRLRMARRGGPVQRSHHDGRRPGDVRIEQVPRGGMGGHAHSGRVTDADYEEVK